MDDDGDAIPSPPPPAPAPTPSSPVETPQPVERAVTPEPPRETDEGQSKVEQPSKLKDERPEGTKTPPGGSQERMHEKLPGTEDLLAKSEARKKLPDKNLDFQVRVRIIEGRQLAGANISPVVRVTMDNQSRQTKVIKSTNKPFYDEVFFFNFNVTPHKLFDAQALFEVFNSKKLRANAMVGSFQCDVGFFYDEPSHSVLRKWILLSDPEDKMAGAKGYLKVTVMVLGPGDEAPVVTITEDQDDLDDIEDNLIQPPGMMLRPAVFSLRVYRAEDIPQMDSAVCETIKKSFVGGEMKELVDPYMMFSFAGKEARTDVHKNCDHPEFKQELHVPFQFPTMAEKLKLQLWDWDKLSGDDCIGTYYLPMSEISGQGEEGYLPRFGPCFINFYGSTREYSDLPDEFDDLNIGVGQGVAYRGRALVELETKLDTQPTKMVEEVLNDDIIRVQTYLRRRKYKLFACFLEATLVACTDGPVTFEISIGNYGNQLDLSVPPSSSSTSPTNAIFDGSYYYFLPWNDIKPCCNVDSHWEDIAFRLEPRNILTRICEQLESDLEKVQLAVSEKATLTTVAVLTIKMLDTLIESCRKPLPQLAAKTPGINDLDLKRRDTRESELKCIIEEASKLRTSATDVDETIGVVEDFLKKLHFLAVEPQNSMPDVVIWMMSGEKRIAYHRIPAYDLLYSTHAGARGKYCGKTLDLFMQYPGKKQFNLEDYPEVPAQVRVMLWLGLEKDQEAWTNRQETEGDFCVFAETYENQMSVLGNWTAKGLPRPAWSNAGGTLKLLKDSFIPPDGWSFDGKWFVNPELSLAYEKDSGCKSFMEDVFENEERFPGGHWSPASVNWTDIHENAATAKDSIVAPEGWEWTSEWNVDTNRAVDEDGWEYTVDISIGSYVAVEKTYHMSRRRRWVRSRSLVKSTHKEEKGQEKVDTEGWEYAAVFSSKFHSKCRTRDLVRRRRWHRKMVQTDPTAPAVFQISDEGRKGIMMVPRMFITFEKPHKYQLRVYLFQGRDLLPADPDGLSDPYVRISFGTQSQVSEIIHRTLCPTWDQTLIFENVYIYGSPEITEASPPRVVLELFDQDPVGRDEFMGRCVESPVVKLNGQAPPAPRLLWEPVKKGTEDGGEILVAFELFLDEGADLPYFPPTKEHKPSLKMVPSGIRPAVQRTAIEVLCWGVRNMKKFQLANVSSPSIEFECGGHVIQSSTIKNTQKNPNFDEPLFFFDTYLPKEELYTPPMNIKVRDNRSFGRRPIVGVYCIKSLQPYRCLPLDGNDLGDDEADAAKDEESGSFLLDISEETDKTELVEEDIDWWSKYYASLSDYDKCGDYIERGYDKIIVYEQELEKVDVFEKFQDMVKTFELHRGKAKPGEDATVVGEFKGAFHVYPLPGNPNLPLPPRILRNLPPSEPVECLVRVYVIKAIDLQPMDPNGLADPYLVVSLGKTKIKDQDKYIPNTLNPVFGKMFEVTAHIPISKDLCVTVMDYDLIGKDDKIGETVVDLENRFLSKFGAMCGLPQTYYTSGISKWRDARTPRQILDKYCETNNFHKPKFMGNNKVIFHGDAYWLEDFEIGMTISPHMGPPDQRLALHLLNGLPLVPEHVETRPLYNTLQPGVEQGKLQMWVDIFPKNYGPPGLPFNISPREPGEYMLRVIIWNTSDVILEEVSALGEAMSDIYVKGWISGIDKQEKTDVHYRSLDGTGNFNWRFLFPFLYIPAEKVMVVRKKAHFWSLDIREQRIPPKLILQIWDNDLFSPDDFLGTLELNLNKMPKPAKNARKCSLDQLPGLKDKPRRNIETVSLFDLKRTNGWWPAVGTADGEQILAGKIEMTLELLTQQEAEEKPAGTGRDEPNQNPTLDPPNRPATSFAWFSSPFKSLRYILWRRYKWKVITFLVICLLLAMVVLFFYAMPGYTMKKIIGV
ncbi:myoferlin-like [Pocillopora damicornis]|uniref:myoferlin-like n=1 Tax=Pocillopora damicornis TaxID=46731 RepID=UPI000F552935|nr:myoferlin-like [Pocillopora damicornis]